MNDQQVISDWFKEYGNDIYHFLIYKVGPTDAEDLLQEVFVKALKGFSRYKGKANPKTWLYSIARNVVIDESRRRKSRKYSEMVPLEETDEPKSSMTPETIIFSDEETKEIFNSIQSLKPHYQDVIVLRSIKELSVKETASILKWSESKVKSTHRRARIALNDQLRRCDNEKQTGSTSASR